MTPRDTLRDAATLIVLRDAATAPSVLMGQRGANAAFLPSKFVFPGGAVDAGDAAMSAVGGLDPMSAEKLALDAAPGLAPLTLALAAIRELWEETGLRLARPAAITDPPPAWQSFVAGGHGPDPAPLRFVFRAATPQGRPRRFDARFFLADAAAILGDPDDFSQASDELSHLQWVPVDQATRLDLPFITQVALAEVAAMLPALAPAPTVPFFDSRSARGRIVHL